MEENEIKHSFGLANFERRMHPRFSLNVPMEYNRVDSPTTLPGRTGNASEGGLMIYLPEQLKIGQNLKVKIFFSSHPDINTVEMISQVVWVDNYLGTDGSYRSAVKFVDISPENVEKLRTILKSLSFD